MHFLSAFLYVCAHNYNMHSLGRLLAARIGILLFFFLESPRSLTRRKIRVRQLSPNTGKIRGTIIPDTTQKNQVAAVTHTGRILTLYLRTIAAHRSHLHMRMKSFYDGGNTLRIF